jgi:hypothetical protein
MLVSFTILGITGLVQKYALSAISLFIVRLWGGIENLRATHHVAATVLMLVVIYHLVEIGYKAFVLRTRMTMLPGIQDVKDAWKAFLHCGIESLRLDATASEEEAEYWALV